MINYCAVVSLQLVEGDVFEEAVRYAKSISKYPVEGRRLSKMAVKGAEKAQVLGEGRC